MAFARLWLLLTTQRRSQPRRPGSIVTVKLYQRCNLLWHRHFQVTKVIQLPHKSCLLCDNAFINLWKAIPLIPPFVLETPDVLQILFHAFNTLENIKNRNHHNIPPDVNTTTVTVVS